MRNKLPSYLSPAEHGWYYAFRFYGLVVLMFLQYRVLDRRVHYT